MSAVDQTITLPAITPATPLILCSSGFLHTLATVERDVANIAVGDAQAAQLASTLLQRLTKAGTELEKARAELKAPFIAKGREIDDAAKAPALRIEAAKTVIKGKVTQWQLEEQRKARVAEEARQAELRRLEALRLAEERAAAEKAAALARQAAENAARLREAAAPTIDVDFDDGPAEPHEPPPKTETELAIEAVRFAPAAVAVKPSGLAFKCSLRIASVDVHKLPDVFVVKTANQMAIRSTFCTGWREGQPLPECAGVVFEIDRTPVSTGKAVF